MVSRMGTHYRGSDALDDIRAQVLTLALAHGRVFRREHLRAWGIDPEVVNVMTRRHMWERLRHGVYVDAAVLDSTRQDVNARHLLDCAASICALERPTYAVATTAAVVHGLPFDRRQLSGVDLVREPSTDVRSLHRRIRSADQLPDVRLRTHRLEAQAATVRSGIPTVCRNIAAVTCAAQADAEWALATLDAAAWKAPEAIRDLAEVMADWPALRGIGVVRSVLPLVRPGAQTPLESLSRYRLMKAGLPEPELQFPLHDSAGLIGYADMAWIGLGVIGEADGLLKYDTREVHIKEKIREDRIRALGFIVVRWTWNDIMRDSRSVASRIHSASMIARTHVG